MIRKIKSLKESELNPTNTYWTVTVVAKEKDGVPAIISGTSLFRTEDTTKPYDKSYSRGGYYFFEKSFDNVRDAENYQKMYDKAVGVDVSALTSYAKTNESIKRSETGNHKIKESIDTELDDVYKILREYEGAWEIPTTGWTGDCELYQRDLDDGSYLFSLVFGRNTSEPDEIVYVPSNINNGKAKFTIYPYSGSIKFCDNINEFKRELRREYSYLKKVR
jgi:hypothetical protein